AGSARSSSARPGPALGPSAIVPRSRKQFQRLALIVWRTPCPSYPFASVGPRGVSQGLPLGPSRQTRRSPHLTELTIRACCERALTRIKGHRLGQLAAKARAKGAQTNRAEAHTPRPAPWSRSNCVRTHLAVDVASIALPSDSRTSLPSISLAVERSNELAEFGAQNALHWTLFRRHNVDFDVPRPQRGRDLEPDEARAQHRRPPRRFGSLDDGPRVVERTQHEHIGRLCAGDGGAHRFGPGCKKEPIEGDFLPVGERDLVRLDVEADNGRSEPQVDGVVRIEARRAKRDPLLRRAAYKIDP